MIHGIGGQFKKWLMWRISGARGLQKIVQPQKRPNVIPAKAGIQKRR
jgi:hypothetical protein